jgi:hypothetical protein
MELKWDIGLDVVGRECGRQREQREKGGDPEG